MKPILTFNYPTVAKTLRDTFGHKGKKKCKEEKEKHGHMCSMMAMQVEGGLGYDDLNELMKVMISHLKWGSKIQTTTLDFEWSKRGWFKNGPDFE